MQQPFSGVSAATLIISIIPTFHLALRCQRGAILDLGPAIGSPQVDSWRLWAALCLRTPLAPIAAVPLRLRSEVGGCHLAGGGGAARGRRAFPVQLRQHAALLLLPLQVESALPPGVRVAAAESVAIWCAVIGSRLRQVLIAPPLRCAAALAASAALVLAQDLRQYKANECGAGRDHKECHLAAAAVSSCL